MTGRIEASKHSKKERNRGTEVERITQKSRIFNEKPKSASVRDEKKSGA